MRSSSFLIINNHEHLRHISDYDALALTPAALAPKEFDQTRFPCIADNLLEAGTQLANRLKQQRKFTDTANFTLKCNVCGLGLIGERDATTHATVSIYNEEFL
ncbi:hypothetical protein INT43_007282 [Umbelopsis isabellina]|uniref:OTU1-like C-terminal C2H2-type zinc finger domain-containing protein n=1 Tax=Mortierella isabellina TaxID=91625 RepID=A0A8H7PXU0_MORIS|nr:hypothetical protein INT43_007282 [Umbelopsis isabellina]